MSNVLDISCSMFNKEYSQHTWCCWSRCTTGDVGGGLADQLSLPSLRGR